ncbi:KdsC family phosphatase [candidate division KSB1 bacterium]
MSNQNFQTEISNRAKKIKALLLDVDGVLTNGEIIYNSSGAESKIFDVQDGLGIYFARKSGLIVGIITGRDSYVTKIRATELHLDYLSQGHKDKLKPYAEFKKKFDLKDNEISFVGDDLLDLPIMVKCGLAVSVANGRQEVKEHSQYITETEGGMGAVRETIEFILKQQGKWQKIVDKYI